MLSPTFRSSDSDGSRKHSLDHGRLQAALFAATGGGVHADDDDHASKTSASNPPPSSTTPPPARTTLSDDEDGNNRGRASASSAAAAAAASKSSSRRGGRKPAVGAAESPTAPFLEHQRGGLLGDTASSSEETVSSIEGAAEGVDDVERRGSGGGGGGGRGAASDNGRVPLLRLTLRAQREFVAVAAAAASPLPPPRLLRKARQRRSPAVATLKEEGIAFTTKGGGSSLSSSAGLAPPSSPSAAKSSSLLLLPPLLPFSDILGAEALPRKTCSSSPLSFLRTCAASSPQQLRREPWLVRVHTVSKGARLGDWRPRAVSLLAPSARAARAWAASISRSAAQSHAGRPRALLVLLNPFGGARGAATRVWRRVAQPLLEGAAGIACAVVETDSAGHAERVVRSLSLERLRGLDGVVVVGGDGLFQEALNGLLAIRFGGNEEEPSASASASASASTFCPLRALEASRLRLGHIPAGSTDALAWSVHGTRCPAAAALHVALGDGARLDVLALGPAPPRLQRQAQPQPLPAAPSSSSPSPRTSSEEEEEEDAAGRSPLTPRGAATSSGGGNGSSSPAAAAAADADAAGSSPASSAGDGWPPRAAACMVSCGYFGDLLALSERMRWLGPARYGVAGFLALATLKRYELRIRYLPADETAGAAADADAEADGAGGGSGGSSSAPATPRSAGPLLPGAVGRAFAPLRRGAAAAAAAAAPPPPRAAPDDDAPFSAADDGWRTDEGAFSAVLLACLPCRSDRSAAGLAPDRALADGLASLVRVRACSRLGFLRFLIAVSRDGARAAEGAAVAAAEAAAAAAAEAAVAAASATGEEAEEGSKEGSEKRKERKRRRKGAAALPWVSVVAVRAVVVEPLAASSAPCPPSRGGASSSSSSPSPSPSSSSSSPAYLPWNADGETLPPSGVAAVVRRGLVRVFARPQLDAAADDE